MSQTRYKQTGFQRYDVIDAHTDARLGHVGKDQTVKSFRIWDAYNAEGEWLRGFDTRDEAARHVLTQSTLGVGPGSE